VAQTHSDKNAAKMPQVTMICHRYYPLPGGGADRLAQRVAEPLAAQGWRMRVLTSRPQGTKGREMVNGVLVRRLGGSSIPKIQGALFLTQVLYRLLTTPGRQVVHLNQMYREMLPAVIARRLRGSPFIVRIATGGEFGDIARLHVIPFGRWMLRLARRADAIISLSQQITDELLRAGFERPRIVEIANGVDIQRFTPASAEEKVRLRRELGLPVEGTQVIFTGRLNYQKGLDTLIRSWKDVQSAHPDARLLLLGKDEEGGTLQQLAAELHLEEAIHFLGHSEQVLPYLRSSDVFVLPSLFEGLSNALLEAMACGLAVVTTNIGGTCEVIRPDIDGLLIEPGDVAALADQLNRVVGDAAFRQQLALQARKRVEEQYTLDRTVERYAALYLRLSGFEVWQEAQVALL
jgi:glycosyltransferase involved in cell wall biosynthesis